MRLNGRLGPVLVKSRGHMTRLTYLITIFEKTTSYLCKIVVNNNKEESNSWVKFYHLSSKTLKHSFPDFVLFPNLSVISFNSMLRYLLVANGLIIELQCIL